MNKYDQSFKDEAVHLALSSAQPIVKTSRDLGINGLPSIAG
jgi:transposase-like protein